MPGWCFVISGLQGLDIHLDIHLTCYFCWAVHLDCSYLEEQPSNSMSSANPRTCRCLLDCHRVLLHLSRFLFFLLSLTVPMSDVGPSRKTVWPFAFMVYFTSELLNMLQGREEALSLFILML